MTARALPDGWVYSTLCQFTQLRARSVSPAKYSEEVFELYSVPSYESGVPERVKGGAIGSSKQVVEPDSVLLCKINPRINRVWVVGRHVGPRQIASTEWIVFPKSESVDPKFLFFYLKQNTVRNFLAQSVSGVGGSLMRVRPSTLKGYPFPVPPLKEQRRIVEKIEALFGKLDQGEAALRKVLRLLLRYRQTVLKDAFSGELTADWRAENAHRLEQGRDLLVHVLQTRREKWQGRGKYKEPAAPDTTDLSELPEGWVWASTEQLAFVETGATPKKGNPEYYASDGTPWITSTAVNEDVITSPQGFITDAALRQTNAKVFPRGSLIVALYGEGKTRGKVSELGMDAATNQACAALIVEHLPQLLKSYLKLFFQYNYDTIRLLSSGGVQPNLNLGLIKSTPIPLPPKLEINEIVNQLEIEMRCIKVITDCCQSELARSATLRQSILKDAFSGRLVTQDPNDDPAAELLARICADSQAAPKKITRKKAKV